ncbi:hypothetical protein D3C71_1144760 [compost metagenome]
MTPWSAVGTPALGMVQEMVCGPVLGLVLPAATEQREPTGSRAPCGPAMLPVLLPTRLTLAPGGGLMVSSIIVCVASEGPALRTLIW